MLRLLTARGVDDLVVVDGFRGDRIRDFVETNFPACACTFIRNEDYATTNNAWSLWLARRGLEDPVGPVLLLDSDIVCEAAVLDRILAAPQPNRLGLRTRGGIGAEEMKVRLSPAGLVADLGKELPLAAAAGESVGLEVFAPDFLADLFAVLERRLLAEGRVNEFYEAAFVETIGLGHDLAAVDLADARCLEIDTAEDLAAARALFAAS